MKRVLAIPAGTVLVLGLLIANLGLALPRHQWWSWHWDISTLHLWVAGSHQPEAVAAIADWDRNIRDLTLHTKFKGHTHISVAGANYGNTGWGGLATIKDYSFDWWHRWCWCRIEHAHAVYNSYYGGIGGTGTNSDIRGIFCQEIGHTFGLEHSNTGDCMGKGYYNNINVTGAHNSADINSIY